MRTVRVTAATPQTSRINHYSQYGNRTAACVRMISCIVVIIIIMLYLLTAALVYYINREDRPSVLCVYTILYVLYSVYLRRGTILLLCYNLGI